MREIRKKFSSYQDEKLLEILHYSEDYKPEVVEVVKEIVAEREINPDLRAEFETSFLLKDAKVAEKESEPLSTGEKIFFLIVPFLGLIVFIFVQLNYMDKGYKKKSEQALNYSLISFGALVVLMYLLFA